jgi:hypothetical protein
MPSTLPFHYAAGGRQANAKGVKCCKALRVPLRQQLGQIAAAKPVSGAVCQSRGHDTLLATPANILKAMTDNTSDALRAARSAATGVVPDPDPPQLHAAATDFIGIRYIACAGDRLSVKAAYHAAPPPASRSWMAAARAELHCEHGRPRGSRVSSNLYGVRLCDLNLGKGREQITFRGTKNGEDVTAALNATAVSILKEYLEWRGKLTDREMPLFLTYRREPYTDNGRAYGGQNKTAFRAARRRAIAAIRDAAEAKAVRLLAGGKTKAAEKAAKEVLEQAEADAVLLGRVTQHWFRHMLATRLIRKDPRAAMEQGGWLDIRSVIGYAQDVPEHRRQLVVDMDEVAAARSRRVKRRKTAGE